jgi:hypothetical protein
VSFGRNLESLFGTDKYQGMHLSPLKAITLDGDILTFDFEDGTSARFGVEGDCCSTSWIEHLEFDPDVIGQKLVTVQDGDATPWDGHECKPVEDGHPWPSNACGHDSLAVYNTVFRTETGATITVEYRNDSNGYYGGSLVRLG